MRRLVVTAGDIERFHRDGYFVVPELLDKDETRLLHEITVADLDLAGSAWKRRDASGVETKLSVRNELGDDVYSAIARCERVVRAMERFLGGEVYHYHHKVMIKEPQVGGAWEWHQDYGYWYKNGCLYPWMASCLIAINSNRRDNGCLQVIPGSHHLGRLDHQKVGDQTGADPERVAEVLRRVSAAHCELEPGSALFFHCNLLHRSDANPSADPRLSLICCYNAARNDPYQEHHHPRYTPLAVLEDAQVLEFAKNHRARLAASG